MPQYPAIEEAGTPKGTGLFVMSGRGAGIRTRDLYVPNVARYQAALLPDEVLVSVPPGRLERPPPAPEAGALSAELRGPTH